MSNIKILQETEEFILSLEKLTIAKILRSLELLEKFKHRLSFPHTKKITFKLHELRIRGKQKIRLFYTFKKSNIYVLHGVIKKKNKIPRKEIIIAQKKLLKI